MVSTDEISTLDTTTMTEVNFDVVSVENGSPIVKVVAVGGRELGKPIETARFQTIVQEIGNTVAEAKLSPLQMAKLA